MLYYLNNQRTMSETVFLLLFSLNLLDLSIQEQCWSDGSDECHIFLWRSWGSCNGACGHQNQNRERLFCCDARVVPHTLDNCVKHCGFHNYETNQNKTCVCENGGTFSLILTSCICGPRNTGDCCQGIDIVFNIIWYI